VSVRNMATPEPIMAENCREKTTMSLSLTFSNLAKISLFFSSFAPFSPPLAAPPLAALLPVRGLVLFAASMSASPFLRLFRFFYYVRIIQQYDKAE
jgi:hypothetical protein